MTGLKIELKKEKSRLHTSFLYTLQTISIEYDFDTNLDLESSVILTIKISPLPLKGRWETFKLLNSETLFNCRLYNCSLFYGVQIIHLYVHPGCFIL